MLWLHSLLTLASLRCVLAGLTNYTIDDATSAVVYSQTPILQCTPNTCPESWTKQLFNGTSTITESPIIIAFTGNAVYIYLAVAGACTFNIDGNNVGVFSNSLPTSNGNIQLAYHNAESISEGDHILLISPVQATMLVEFDYIIYTAATKDSSRRPSAGVIVGGALGTVAAVSGLVTAAFLWRQHDRQKKLFLWGVRLVDGDKSSMRMGQMPIKISA